MKPTAVIRQENIVENKRADFIKVIIVIFLLYECMRDVYSLSHVHDLSKASSVEIFDAALHFVAALFLLPHRIYEILSHHTRAAFITALIITAVGILCNFLIMPRMVATAILVIAICTFFIKRIWANTKYVLGPILFFDFVFGLVFIYYLFTPSAKI